MKTNMGFPLKALVFCVLAGGRAEALEQANIPSQYPTAISIQIDPARVSKQDLQLIKKVGFEYVRFGVRPPVAAISGKNPDYAGLLARLRAVQLKPILTLFGGPDVWGEQNSAAASRHTASQSAISFANFAVDFMGRHPDPDILWELWNEPEIPTFLKPELLHPVLVPSVQQICSSLQSQESPNSYKVFGFGFSHMPHTDGGSPYDELLDVSLKTCLSGISIHPYRQKPESLINDFAEIHQVMHKYDKSNAPVIASEWGYSSVAPTRDQNGQAMLVLREYLSSVFVRLSLLNIYAWKDAGGDPRSIEDNYGLIDVDGRPKPAMLAMQHLLSRIAQTQLVAAKTNGGDYLLTLSSLEAVKQRRTVYIAWSGTTQGGGTYRFARNGAKTCVISEFQPAQFDRACPESGEVVGLTAGSAPLALTLSF
ncbi:MAG: hypothetical protein ABI171_12750 [Collimonas sp.]|uniref:hypothetical protein n=1 Tax=Collimonas sp. TaxID=1963772 RepID=UPI003262FE27